MVSFLIHIKTEKKAQISLNSVFIKKQKAKTFSFDNGDEITLIGDAIFDKSQISDYKTHGQLNPQWLINNVLGHYYYLIKKGDKIIIGNSNFSILPVYYYKDKNEFSLSNSVQTLNDKIEGLSINKRFLLENILFNYQLFNETSFREVKLLPSNSYMEFSNDSFKIKSLIPIEEYITSNPIPWKESVNQISDLFIERSGNYFPDEEYAASLTGGFDGRTLIGLSKYYNKQFSTYSFGSKESSDVKIATHLSSLANLNFIPFELNEDYVNNLSLQNGLDFIKGAEGNASFSRAHYMHSIKELAKNYNYLITGNFGSEVFRAAHIAGVVISQNLYNLFSSDTFDLGILKVEGSNEFKWINKIEFVNEWESLKSDLKTLPCFDDKFNSLTKNQQFYKFVFEEIFRKYFGAEMVNQYQYIVNRTPFLDFEFIKEILKTELSGVYSDYFTNNPLKRFKGQVVYANIINKTFPVFGKEITDKGYRPDDLLSNFGKLRIAKSYFKKKILKTTPSLTDENAVDLAFDTNRTFWEDIPINDQLFNKKFILESIDTRRYRDSLFIVLSQIWNLNYLLASHE